MKGYFRYPPDKRADYLRIAALPPDKKADNLRVCFRHFQENDLIFVGDQLRIRKGKICCNLIKTILSSDTLSSSALLRVMKFVHFLQ